ncbi:hypothetical protein [Aeoliella mucimassa]|uniref:Alpha-agarase n=1 Tax=Aeoliella mucimassa TaxID=2527972 RepID=A0A518AUD2_9BACT|nr:hypothetical protein [Aeoliella mucimassa]QDU58331.1 hypothetical protein Pan181_45650 [Aeoliella mucimassa]
MGGVKTYQYVHPVEANSSDNTFARVFVARTEWRIAGEWHFKEKYWEIAQGASTDEWQEVDTVTYTTSGPPVGFENGEDWYNSCDIDGDGLPNSQDGDIDDDGLPNSVDDDDDGDGIRDEMDEFPHGNPVCGGGDMDGDGVGNCEDGDVDGDGIPNSEDDDDDGDGSPDAEDEFPRGQDCSEEPDPDPEPTPPWWQPPGNEIERETVIVFPPGDIDGDGIPNQFDDDADGDGIPNWSDPDADGNGTDDAYQDFPEPTPAPDPPIGIDPPGPPPSDPPSYDPPPVWPDPPATGDCDPCYWLEIIANELKYQNSGGGFGGGADTGEDYWAGMSWEVPDMSNLNPPQFEIPDFSGGSVGSYYFDVPFYNQNFRQRVSVDMTLNDSFYSEVEVFGAVDALREFVRVFFTFYMIVYFIRRSAYLLFRW